MTGPIYDLGEEHYEAFLEDGRAVRIETPTGGVTLPPVQAMALAQAVFREMSEEMMDIPSYKEGYEDAEKAIAARSAPQQDNSKGSAHVEAMRAAGNVGRRLGYEAGVKAVMSGLRIVLRNSIERGELGEEFGE